jgi:transcription elongation factor Elf1
MKLIARCPGCQQKVELDNKASDRGELKTYIGSDQVDGECSDCGESCERHINHIQAQVDYKIVILAISLGVLATVVLWQFYVCFLYFFG